jgi:glycosyltransferase involved in cell wall biosynthesis
MTKIPPQKNPLVSVCIPTYNRAERLRRAIQRVLDCSYHELEIIISDNGSSDATQAVCAEFAARHPNIHCFHHATNQGPQKNFEFARAQARGKYFIWHGDDDYLAPDFIGRCVETLESDASLALVCGLGAYHRGDHLVTRHGNVVQLDGRFGLLRALYFICTVQEGSIFCGVYDREQVADCKLPNSLAGDHVWLANVLLEGKARVLTDTFVYREEWDNTSSSTAKIVATLGLPQWQARFPWVAIPHNLAHGVAWESPHYQRLAAWRKLLIYALVYVVSFVRQWVYAALIRARRICRKILR